MPKVIIYKNENVVSNELKKIDKYFNNIKVQTENNIDNIENKRHALYYTDAYTYSKNYKNYKILSICSIPKQVLLVSNRNINLMNSGVLNIGYINNVDLELFKILMKSQKNYTNLNNFNFIQISKNDIIPSLFVEEFDNSFNKLEPNPSKSWAPHRVFNIGNSEPTPLMQFIEAIENSLGKKAKKNFLPMQQGDVQATSADTKLLEKMINFKPYTSVEVGVKKFVDWYVDFYEVS